MLIEVRKRDGRIENFDTSKIEEAIKKAVEAVGGSDFQPVKTLTRQVVAQLQLRFVSGSERTEVPTIEDIQDNVEKVLIENGHAKVAKAYILYREKRRATRDIKSLIGATIGMFSDYLGDKDWQVKENANTHKSVNGLNNYVREVFTKNYWLNEIYPSEIAQAHESGDIHLHDLGFFGPYCAGWDLRQLLTDGFGGVESKVESKPARHLRSFLGQIVNSTFTTQGETAGAQAWSSFDTYCAPFIRHDKLSYAQVKQALQEFVFNINVPTRVGFQCPFSNLTFDITVPKTLAQTAVIIGGQMQETCYGDYQAEMDIFNQAFCEVMLEGDAKGRVFTFPIPTINVTKEFDWDSPVVDRFVDITCKYGIPYFANYVNAELSPEDAVSMCCRLRLDTSELRKRGGGLFGSNPLTGSIGVVTLNLPRIGYLAKDRADFFARLKAAANLAKESLEIKRKIIERETGRGLYPYSAHYLRHVKQRTKSYWTNHFNTIGLVGMHEAILNFAAHGGFVEAGIKGKDGLDSGITSPEGQAFAAEVMHFLRDLMVKFQEETGHFYNLEATPAEGTSYRLARADRRHFPDIICGGGDTPYYTNSTQLPVAHTSDIFETLRLQDGLQSLYTGGTVLHLYLGESIEDPKVCKRLIQKVFSTNKLPYLSITPTFSICNIHGYLKGEQFACPSCGDQTEVWTRVVGYLRPVQKFNDGKRKEYHERAVYALPVGLHGDHPAAIDYSLSDFRQ
jgi:ribonucleoside-triphosphate reductase